MDGEIGDIPNYFKRKYKKLYNSVNDREELLKVKELLDERINLSSIHDVEKVTPSVVMEATKRLGENKSDPYHSFTSDCLKNCSDELFHLLSLVIKGFLIHGHVTNYLLLATLVPIVKNHLESINSSKNYRAIAMSSVILKILDWIILILFGNTLGLDDLLPCALGE